MTVPVVRRGNRPVSSDPPVRAAARLLTCRAVGEAVAVGDAGRERRIVTSALVLVAAVALGLGLGAAFSPEGSTRALAVPALGLQTLLTVGALPRRERSLDLRPGLDPARPAPRARLAADGARRAR